MTTLVISIVLACSMKKALEPIPVLDGYDIERASLTDSGFFQRFSVPSQLPLLTDSGMDVTENVLVLKQDGDWLTFPVRQMGYHHVAQGEWEGTPYLVVF